MLNTTCSSSSDWPSGLWKVQQSINMTVQKSTGYTPLRLLIGCNANIPCIQTRFDKVRRDNVSFEIGNEVYVNQDHRRCVKLNVRFKGTYKITGILSNDRYSLQGLGNLRNIIVAKDKLRKWHGEWVDEHAVIEASL